MEEQVTIFAVYITAAECYFIAIGRYLKLVYDVNYSLATDEQVEVCLLYTSDAADD